jgi:hypothetical protein
MFLLYVNLYLFFVEPGELKKKGTRRLELKRRVTIRLEFKRRG